MPVLILSQGQITELLRVSRPTLKRYEEKGMPVISRGKYDGGSVVAWYVNFKKELDFMDRQEAGEDNPERRLVVARAEKIERENAEAENKLLPREDVEAFATTSGVIVNNAFESLGARLCNQLAGMDDPAEIQSVLHSEARDTLGSITEKAKESGLEVEIAE